MYITLRGPHPRNDLYGVEWDVKLYTMLYYTIKSLLAGDGAYCDSPTTGRTACFELNIKLMLKRAAIGLLGRGKC